MSLRERVRALEGNLRPDPGFRLLYVADDADQAAEVAQFREQTGYKGPVVCMCETDARL